MVRELFEIDPKYLPLMDPKTSEWEEWKKETLQDLKVAFPQFKWKPFKEGRIPGGKASFPSNFPLLKGWEICITSPERVKTPEGRTWNQIFSPESWWLIIFNSEGKIESEMGRWDLNSLSQCLDDWIGY